MNEEELKQQNPQPEGESHINPGDKESPPGTSVEEKGKRVAVEYQDALNNDIEVPTYFVAEGEDGEKEALHHVKDAEKISDVIREARVNEDGERTWR